MSEPKLFGLTVIPGPSDAQHDIRIEDAPAWLRDAVLAVRDGTPVTPEQLERFDRAVASLAPEDAGQ